MNLISVKEVGYNISMVDNTFDRLRKFIECFRDEEELISFDNNKDIIYEKIDSLINWDNKHLFSTLFLLYAFCEAIANKSDNQRIWEKSLEIIEKVCSDNINEVAYYYTGATNFYINENRAVAYPNTSILYNEGSYSFSEILCELLKSDDKLREVLKKFDDYEDKIIYDKYHDSPDIRKSLHWVLAVIASYCIVNKDYDKFDSFVTKVLDNVEYVYSKVKMNSLEKQFGIGKLVNGNPYAEQCVEFVLDVVNSNDKRTIK
jgi:hypothetical protein